MFVKTCYSCKSASVSILKSHNDWRTIHQYCARCGANQTAYILKKKRRASIRAKVKRHHRARAWVLSTVTALSVVALVAHASPVETYDSTIDATTTPIIVTPVTKIPEIVAPKKPETREEVRAYILAEAKTAGVHVAKIEYIVENESRWNRHAKGDMNLICTNKRSPVYGKPVEARGPWQITKCWFPHISDEEAYDVEWSTKWALDIISKSKKDCIQLWSTCRMWYNQ